MTVHGVGVALLAGTLSCLTESGMTAATPGGTPATSQPGMSKLTAIEVCEVVGEREYLKKLRCADDYPPTFERAGNAGMRNEIKTADDERVADEQFMSTKPLKSGVTDFHTVDRYEVVCRGKTVNLYLDMYHCPESKTHAVPPGFTLNGQKKP